MRLLRVKISVLGRKVLILAPDVEGSTVLSRRKCNLVWQAWVDTEGERSMKC